MPHGARQADNEVARLHIRYAVADLLHDARCLVTKQKRELIGDCAFAVVQVGMAYAARLHLDERLARTRIWHDNRLHRYCLALRARDDALNLIRHILLPPIATHTLRQ